VSTDRSGCRWELAWERSNDVVMPALAAGIHILS
jgi:hypothetical protein